MPHSKELMADLAKMVESEYPGHECRYDVALRGCKKRPDAYVLSPSGNVLAVFEVGYTDAAKIALYRKMSIPDIRWYDHSLNLVLQERHSEAKAPPLEPIKRDLPYRRVNGPAGWAVPLLEARIAPPVGVFSPRIDKAISEMFPGPFGYFPYRAETTCVLCADDPLGCDASRDDLWALSGKEDDCANQEYVFFDDQKVSVLADCGCAAAHECWVAEEEEIDPDSYIPMSYHRLCDEMLWWRLGQAQGAQR